MLGNVGFFGFRWSPMGPWYAELPSWLTLLFQTF
jgi:hypothetical protein